MRIALAATRSWRYSRRLMAHRLAIPGILAWACSVAIVPTGPGQRLEPAPAARTYVCVRVPDPPVIDGRLDDTAWTDVRWSEPFVDIEGDRKPTPPLRTRMKLAWDDEYLYVAGVLEDPHVWSTITERDAVIYQDDDFEIFLDPDGDTHEYYELEINALGTVWDLFLVRPYRDGGPALHGWDIAGLRSAVAVDGSLNDASDEDRGWTVELALPWAALAEAAPGGRPPDAGDHWRINFSRVDWDMEVADGRYLKRTDPDSGRPTAEHNWVWSPQGAIDMHRPERWGIVEFSPTVAGRGEAAFTPPADEDVRWALRRVYDAERTYFRAHRRYTSDLPALGLETSGWRRPAGFSLDASDDRFDARASGSEPGTTWRIREDGRLWMDR
jgi:hypothetical protein